MSATLDTGRTFVPAPNPRTGALVGVGALTAGYCSTLYWVTTVRGGTGWLLLGLLVAVVLALVLRPVRERHVLGAALPLALAGAGLYFWLAPQSLDVGRVIALLGEPLVLGSGNSLLTISAVHVWIAVVVPPTVLLSSYLALRRRYVAATLAGGWLLVLLALTGDATVTETLVGSLGAAAGVGFGELDRRDAPVAGGDLVVVLVACMAVLAVTVPLVPSGSADPIDPVGSDGDGWVGLGGDGDAGSGTGDDPGNDTDAATERGEPVPLDDQVLQNGLAVPGGPIELSPDVRFVVESEVRAHWRVDVLDRYTGDAWIRTGASAWELSLPEPPGPNRTVEQSVDLRAPTGGLPAAAYPVEFEGLGDVQLRTTSTGSPDPVQPLPAEQRYRVRSEVPSPTVADLRGAGTDYPADVERRYAQLSTPVPERVVERTDRVTSQAETPYDTALAVQSYLQDTKDYSQNVSAPEGDVVDGFLFEMEAGYCTYFASSMAAMLRTQDVPARVAVGYDSGQWAGNDTWIVRGTDAHAWVEVYFPEVGWIEFDPTPARPLRAQRVERLDAARESGAPDVDVPESTGRNFVFERPDDLQGSEDDGRSGTGEGGNGTAERGELDPEELIPERYQAGSVQNRSSLYVDPAANDTAGSAPEANATPDSPGDRERRSVPTGHRLLDGLEGPILALVLVAGSVAGARRTNAVGRARASTTMLWQRRRSPERDVERAIARLDRLLAGRHRPRRPSETRREYLATIGWGLDGRVHRAVALHERARYAGEVDRETADELVELVDELVREHHPVASHLPT